MQMQSYYFLCCFLNTFPSVSQLELHFAMQIVAEWASEFDSTEKKHQVVSEGAISFAPRSLVCSSHFSQQIYFRHLSASLTPPTRGSLHSDRLGVTQMQVLQPKLYACVPVDQGGWSLHCMPDTATTAEFCPLFPHQQRQFEYLFSS